jgi:hypothetical protein
MLSQYAQAQRLKQLQMTYQSLSRETAVKTLQLHQMRQQARDGKRAS